MLEPSICVSQLLFVQKVAILCSIIAELSVSLQCRTLSCRVILRAHKTEYGFRCNACSEGLPAIDGSVRGHGIS